MVTDKQIANLHKLESDDLITIMHECAEALGVVSVSDYCKIMNTDRFRLNRRINGNQVKYVKIAGNKFPIINE